MKRHVTLALNCSRRDVLFFLKMEWEYSMTPIDCCFSEATLASFLWEVAFKKGPEWSGSNLG